MKSHREDEEEGNKSIKSRQVTERNPLYIPRLSSAQELKPTQLMHQIHQSLEKPGRRVVPSCPRCLQSPQHLYIRPACIIPPPYF